MNLLKEKYCAYCDRKISINRNICEFCEQDLLTQEDYENILQKTKLSMEVLFDMSLDEDIKVVLIDRQHKEPIKRKKDIFFCEQRIGEYIAQAAFFRELVSYWMEENIPEVDKNERKDIAYWYELCFMEMSGCQYYVKNRKESICLSVKRTLLLELLEKYSFEVYGHGRKMIEAYLNKDIKNKAELMGEKIGLEITA